MFFSDLKATLKSSKQELKKTNSLVGGAIMSALNVVLNQFAIPFGTMLEVGFAFVASASCAFLYGPWIAGMAGVVADLIGYFMRPSGGFFFGFTINEFVMGFLYGIFLYKKPISLKRIIFAAIATTLIVNLTLTPIWLNMMYGKAFFATLGIRLIKNAIKLPIEVAVIYVSLKTIEKAKNRI